MPHCYSFERNAALLGLSEPQSGEEPVIFCFTFMGGTYLSIDGVKLHLKPL